MAKKEVNKPKDLTIKVKSDYRGGLSYNNGKNVLSGDQTMTLPYAEAVAMLEEFKFLEEVKKSAIIDAEFTEVGTDKGADKGADEGADEGTDSDKFED